MRSSDNHNNSLLSRGLDTEERQWVRDLATHTGFRLYLQALREHMAQALSLALSSPESQTRLAHLDRYNGMLKAFNLPQDLLTTEQTIKPSREE